MDVGEPEEAGGKDECLHAAEAWFEQVLQDAAEEEFLGNRREQERDEECTGYVSDRGAARVKGDEVSGEAEAERDGEEEGKFAEPNLEVVERGDERVTDARKPAYHYIEVERDVTQVKLGNAAKSGVGPGWGENSELENESDAEKGDEVLPGEVRRQVGKFEESGERDGEKGEAREVDEVKLTAGDGEDGVGNS